ncbi:MAG: Fe-S protein assembly co-chaperone HscB [Proteobacteria bacterium]|nr:MAG: Fe-S protein assembly co-chaperone HscB [Pseudomonadota bacterium]
MSINFKQNYFELFGLPVQFDVDNAMLMAAFRKLQAAHHPDRFASGSDEEKRIAQQVTSFINTAQETLSNPRLRARYLLSLKGVDLNDEVDTTSDMAFLMSQMERREALEQVTAADDPLSAIDALSDDVRREKHELEQAFVIALEAEQLEDAKQAVLKLKFFERLMDEIRQLEARLEDDAI